MFCFPAQILHLKISKVCGSDCWFPAVADFALPIAFRPPQKLQDALHFLIESQNRYRNTPQFFPTSVSSSKSLNSPPKTKRSVRSIRSSQRGNFPTPQQQPSSPHTLGTRPNPRTPFREKHQLVKIVRHDLTESIPSKLGSLQRPVISSRDHSRDRRTRYESRAGNKENREASDISSRQTTMLGVQKSHTFSIVSPDLRIRNDDSSEDSEGNVTKGILPSRFER